MLLLLCVSRCISSLKLSLFVRSCVLLVNRPLALRCAYEQRLRKRSSCAAAAILEGGGSTGAVYSCCGSDCAAAEAAVEIVVVVASAGTGEHEVVVPGEET